MRSKALVAVLVLSLVPLIAAGNEPPRVSESDLTGASFTVGPLVVEVMRFRGSFLKLGNGSIELRVENTSNAFATFSPQRLTVVNSDNEQVDVRAVQVGDVGVPPADRRVAPGAWLRESYSLTGKVGLPARLLYDEKELAVITE